MSSHERRHVHASGEPGSTPGAVAPIRRLARQAERRIRLGRALRVGGRALSIALALAVVDVALRKAGVITERQARWTLVVLSIGTLAAIIAAWSRRLPARAGARALDRLYDLHDRLANALTFAELPAEQRTAFMEAAIDDAAAVAPGVRARAVRVPIPWSLAAAAGLGFLLAAVLVFEVRQHVPVARATTIDPVEMAADDLDDVKDFVRRIDQKTTDGDTKAAIEEFNKLVDDIANKRLDRTEAFRRMEALEDRLLAGTEADKKAFDEELERMGEDLKKAELTRPAGEALADHKLDRARDALHDLAKKVRPTDKPIDKERLDRMRAALKEAAAAAARRQRALEDRRQELADEILKMKQKVGDGGSDEERSLLEKKQRELERLDRDLEARSDAGRKLDRLDRELDQAAEDLMRDLGESAKDLDQGAEDINRMLDEEMSQQEKEELRQKLEELRELVRQQGQGGQGQMTRLRRFGRIARGQGGGQRSGGSQRGEGPGDGQDGSGGQAPQGQGGGQGEDGQGGSQGGGGQAGETWVLGPDGEKMLMLSKGQGSSDRGKEPGGDGRGGGGREPGEGHDPHVQGQATRPKMGTEDTQVQGSDTGQGGSRSQVILGAAERGFASHGYKRVYTEYHQVAEESLAKDEIPGGYRFYVKRYFQLIRPREGP